MTVYLNFEHAVALVLTILVSVRIVAAIWKLAIKVLYSLVLSDTFDLTDLAAFQGVFGMIFTVIIALEFKRTLLLVSERTESVVQVRAVILIALLAIVRKLIILDISPGDVGARGGDPVARRRVLARQGSRETGTGVAEFSR